jgi:hypothetical protein
MFFRRRSPLLKLSSINGQYAYLLGSLLLLLALYPFFETAGIGRGLLNVLITAVLIAGVYTVLHDRKLFLIALVLAVPMLVAQWSLHRLAGHGIVLVGSICGAAFFLFNSVTILSHILKGAEVTVDTIFGAVSVYLLFGLGFAFAFMAIDLVHPGALVLNPPQAVQDARDISFYTYYSFVTLTTLGYGDINPGTAPAQAFSYLEAVAGQIYLAVLIARLVGLHIAQSNRHRG